MPIYLYALSDREHDVTNVSGVTHELIFTVRVAEIVAVVGRVDGRPNPTRESLEAQDRVVRSLHERMDALLPARFGTIYPDEAALARAIGDRASDLRQRFDVVRSRDQMTIRVIRAVPASAPAPDTSFGGASPDAPVGPGTHYLEERARRAMPPAVAALAAAVRSVQRGTRVEAGRSDAVVATMYHLVAPGDVQTYRRLIEHAADALPGIRVVMSGPSPAYAFADLDVVTA